MPVITIAREFGAGGSRVAAMLAQRLGAEVIDRQLVAEVARRLSLTTDEVIAEEERPRSVVDRLIRTFAWISEASSPGWSPPYGDPIPDPQRAIRLLTEEVIQESARRGNAIIVGRGGAFLLADWPGVLHVFLRSAEPVRTREVMARLAVTEEEARRRLHQTDADRAAYARQEYATDWRDPRHYDLVLDTGRLGYQRAAETILAALGS
ncbi:MAG TPA: cytidylate kinase-like family protein [Candidatus Limnocylindrales bacterium]